MLSSIINFGLSGKSVGTGLKKPAFSDPNLVGRDYRKPMSTLSAANTSKALSNEEIKSILCQSKIAIPKTEVKVIQKIQELKAKQDKVYQDVTGRTRRHPHVDAPTPYHIPAYLKLEADIVRLQKALPGKWQTVVTVNRGLSNRFVVEAAHARGLNAVLIGTPSECATAVSDGFDVIIPIAEFDYMNGQQILEYVQQHVEAVDPRAIAINPGIAFLSEQASFSGQVADFGYDYMGGVKGAIEAVGDKGNSKKIAEAAFASMSDEERAIFEDQPSPVIFSIPCEDCDDDEKLVLVRKAMVESGTPGNPAPILMKNSDGGGGRGIEPINPDMSDEEIIDIFKRQAMVDSTFAGRNCYLLEKFISKEDNPRHIEVQILENNLQITVDGETLIVDLRDCSDQLKMAKMLEKSAVGLSERTRLKIAIFCKHFVSEVNKNYGSVMIGTIEFLVDKKQHIFFMEMNTRLQVENIVSAFMVSYQKMTGQEISYTQAATMILGGLMDTSRGVPFSEDLRTHDSSVEQPHYVRQVRVYGMKNETQAPYIGMVHVDGLREAEELPGVLTNFVNKDKPYRLNPKLNTQFGEVIVAGEDPETVDGILLEALQRLQVLEGETNIPLLIELLQHPEMQGTPDIHTMGQVIEDRQAYYKEYAAVKSSMQEAAQLMETAREKQQAATTRFNALNPVWQPPKRSLHTAPSLATLPSAATTARFGRVSVSLSTARSVLGFLSRVVK